MCRVLIAEKFEKCLIFTRVLLGARTFTFTLEGTGFFRPECDILTIRLVTDAKSVLSGKMVYEAKSFL